MRETRLYWEKDVGGVCPKDLLDWSSDATVLTEETTCAGLALVSDLGDAEGHIGVVMGPGGPGGAAGAEVPLSMWG